VVGWLGVLCLLSFFLSGSLGGGLFCFLQLSIIIISKLFSRKLCCFSSFFLCYKYFLTFFFYGLKRALDYLFSLCLIPFSYLYQSFKTTIHYPPMFLAVEEKAREKGEKRKHPGENQIGIFGVVLLEIIMTWDVIFPLEIRTWLNC